MSTLAIFVALGGTSYALTLPRNSVDREHLRTNSVGGSEIRRQAVGSSELRNRSIELRDVSGRARAALQGKPSTFFQSVNSGGVRGSGNAAAVSSVGTNGTVVQFSRSVASCVAVASLTAIPGGPFPDPPGNGHVTAEPAADGRVLVETFAPDGQPAQYPFNLIVAC
jgi:hypothetical protein